MDYIVGWIVVAFCGLALMALIVWPIRKHKILSAYVILMGSYWMFFPWKFDDAHFAPLYIVFLFQTFIEEGIDYSEVVAAAVIGTTLITVIMLMVYLGYFIVAYRTKRGKLP